MDDSGHHLEYLDKICDHCKSLLGNHVLPRILNIPPRPEKNTHIEWGKLLCTFKVLKQRAHTCGLCRIILDALQVPPCAPEPKDLIQDYEDALEQDTVNIFLRWTIHLEHSGNRTYLVLGGDHPQRENFLHGDVLLWHMPYPRVINLLNSRYNSDYFPGKMRSRTIDQINQWTGSCSKHSVCENARKLNLARRRLPTRLIDIGISNSDMSIKLGHELPLDTEYLTLSHRWGGVPPVRLLKDLLVDFMQSIPFHSLPQTFRDAVDLTRELGFRYLWIDAICIIQDCQEDWRLESSLMGDVYAFGRINIAATASNDGHGGLFYQETRVSDTPCLIRLQERDENQIFILAGKHDNWRRMIETPEDAPLANRGWVLQERALSPQVVHFGRDQVYWECGTKADSEFSLLAGTIPGIPLKMLQSNGGHSDYEESKNRNWIYNNWITTVEKYSECQLTESGDKLPAISGIAQRYRELLGETPESYLAGLWKGSLPLTLLWGLDSHEKFSACHAERAPSWSWACHDGLIRPLCIVEEQKSQTRVLDSETFHNGDPFGQVTGGYLILQGPLFLLKISETEVSSSFSDFVPGPISGTSTPSTIRDKDISWDGLLPRGEISRSNCCFLLITLEDYSATGQRTKISGLVLCATKLSRGQYQRVGVVLNKPMLKKNIKHLLQLGKRTDMLDPEMYLEADTKFGFKIEIV